MRQRWSCKTQGVIQRHHQQEALVAQVPSSMYTLRQRAPLPGLRNRGPQGTYIEERRPCRTGLSQRGGHEVPGVGKEGEEWNLKSTLNAHPPVCQALIVSVCLFCVCRTSVQPANWTRDAHGLGAECVKVISMIFERDNKGLAVKAALIKVRAPL